MRHRHPNQKRRFCWARIPSKHGCTWRLFRRSETTGRIYCVASWAPAGATRSLIAREVWRARIQLRETVDTVDLERLGVAA
jgi:hypothetical protein